MKGAHVSVPVAGVGKGLVADVAGVRLLARMDQLVLEYVGTRPALGVRDVGFPGPNAKGTIFRKA